MNFYKFLFKINIPETTNETAQNVRATKNRLLMY